MVFVNGCHRTYVKKNLLDLTTLGSNKSKQTNIFKPAHVQLHQSNQLQ